MDYLAPVLENIYTTQSSHAKDFSNKFTLESHTSSLSSSTNIKRISLKQCASKVYNHFLQIFDSHYSHHLILDIFILKYKKTGTDSYSFALFLQMTENESGIVFADEQLDFVRNSIRDLLFNHWSKDNSREEDIELAKKEIVRILGSSQNSKHDTNTNSPTYTNMNTNTNSSMSTHANTTPEVGTGTSTPTLDNSSLFSRIEAVAVNLKLNIDAFSRFKEIVRVVPARTVNDPSTLFIAAYFDEEVIAMSGVQFDPSVYPRTLPDLHTVPIHYFSVYMPSRRLVSENDVDWSEVSRDQAQHVNSVIKRNAHMMKQYNVSALTGTTIFDKETKKKTPAILIYVKHFGVITYHDDPLPDQLENVPVVVREGEFTTHSGPGRDDARKQVRPLAIGLSINCHSKKDDKELKKEATIGAFFRVRARQCDSDKKWGHFFLTAGHALENDQTGEIYGNIEVFQKRDKSVGRYCLNLSNFKPQSVPLETTIDAMLVQMDDDPVANVIPKHNFMCTSDECWIELSESMDFYGLPSTAHRLASKPNITNKTCDVRGKHLDNSTMFQMGGNSGLGVGHISPFDGYFERRNGNTALFVAEIPEKQMKTYYANQIIYKGYPCSKIMGVDGDSGALVFSISECGNEAMPCGMFIGSVNGLCLFTPIQDIIKAAEDKGLEIEWLL